MKSLCDPRSVQKLVFVTSVFVLLAWQAAGQQPTSRAKPEGSSHPAAETPATRSLPIIGNGTVNTVPLFTGTYTIGNSLITQSKGALNVSGGVTARSFTGDGTALTNVNAAKLSGLSSSSFAQTSVANTFNADQTIYGNVNFTGSAKSTLILQGNVFDANGEESANVIGGYPGNVVDPGVIGATIGGGGGLFNSASRRPA